MGLYAIPAGIWKGEPVDGIGEWIMLRKRIPRAEYETLAKQFDPVRFDAAAWVDLAVQAGMRYLVITAKHHDGFALYRSPCCPYNIVDATPFGRDALAELADACRAAGITLGFYYSRTRIGMIRAAPATIGTSPRKTRTSPPTWNARSSRSCASCSPSTARWG